MIEKIQDTSKIEHLFSGWEETLIWSCLQGVMGAVYAKHDGESGEGGLQSSRTAGFPQSAMVFLGDFAFLGGKPDKDLACFYPVKDNKEGREFVILVPQNEEWCRMIESCFGERARKVTRYAIKKEGDIFDRGKLKAAVERLDRMKTEGKAVSASKYSIREIDETIFAQCREKPWSRDLVSNYADYAEYQRLGLGMVVLKDGEPVAGASSYSSYKEGIEIEIDTREDCRRQGLAYACGAALILKCLECGLYPAWDAQNRASVALAEKLGYHFSHEYVAYEIEETI